MMIIFLAADNRTLTTRHVDHVHISEVEDDDDSLYYDALYFFLDHGMLVLATSEFARKSCGRFLGVIKDGDDPEQLREIADREAIEELNARQVRMQ